MGQNDAQAAQRTVVISDLHLSQGWSPTTGKLHRDEDFYFDDCFDRFLDALHASCGPGETVRLVIAGDFIDFLQVTRILLDDHGRPARSFRGRPLTPHEQRYGLGSSPEKTVWKLNRVIRGHPLFFAALSDFLARGHELVVLPGNHDIEWVAPKVQTYFQTRLRRLAGGDPRVAGRISFRPWFYYDPACSLFVEHGCQYDGLNSFDTLLFPYLPDDHFNLPAGSFFVRYLFNQIEHVSPQADNLKPATKFIRWSLRQPRAWKQAPLFAEFLRLTLRKARLDRLPARRIWGERCRAQQEEELTKLAPCSGLSDGQLRRLTALWEPSALHRAGASSLRMVASFLSAGAGPEYFAGAALEVGEITGVRFVVFGHTHQTWLAANREGTVRYANSGTWTTCFVDSYERRLLEEESEFALVDIHYDDEAGATVLELKKWVDARGTFEPIRLFNTDGEEQRDLREPERADLGSQKACEQTNHHADIRGSTRTNG